MTQHVGQQEPPEASAEQRTSSELVKWIRKLRWIRVEREAEALQAAVCRARRPARVLAARTQLKRGTMKIFIATAIIAMTYLLCVHTATAARTATGNCIRSGKDHRIVERHAINVVTVLNRPSVGYAKFFRQDSIRQVLRQSSWDGQTNSPLVGDQGQ